MLQTTPPTLNVIYISLDISNQLLFGGVKFEDPRNFWVENIVSNAIYDQLIPEERAVLIMLTPFNEFYC